MLRGVADTLAAQVRAGDLVARLGGEELLVGLAGTDPTQALALAERLRSTVARCAHPLKDGQVLHCTVNIGVSGVLQQRAAWEAGLRDADADADAALYSAKQAGRNRVVAASEVTPAQNQ